MERESLFLIIAFLISIIDLFFYWKGIFRGEIIPHPFTFFIWTVILTISSLELIRGEEWRWVLSISIPTMSCFFALIFGMSKWKILSINWLDYFFFISGICLIIFWQIEPRYTHVLIVMIVIDATAYASSFKKAWIAPFTENSLPYLISVGVYIATILAISVWNFENLGLWIWTAGVNFTFACFIFGRQYYVKRFRN